VLVRHDERFASRALKATADTDGTDRSTATTAGVDTLSAVFTYVFTSFEMTCLYDICPFNGEGKKEKSKKSKKNP
jgi:hypothetical protein